MPASTPRPATSASNRSGRLVTDLDGGPALIELELIEPNLYLATHPPAAAALAEAALLRIDVDADRDVLQ